MVFKYMKLLYSFIIKNKIIQENIWQLYFKYSPIDHSVIAHSYEDYNGNLDINIISRIETSWSQKMNLHFELYKHLINSDCSHLIILSESCIPLQSMNALAKRIESANGTLLTPLAFAPNHQQFFPNHHWRKAPLSLKKYFVTHEDWMILTRNECQIMLNNEIEIKSFFKKTKADCEILLGTSLNKYMPNFKIDSSPLWQIEWNKGKNHPNIIKKIEYINQESYFLRKVNELTDISLALENLMIT